MRIYLTIQQVQWHLITLYLVLLMTVEMLILLREHVVITMLLVQVVLLLLFMVVLNPLHYLECRLMHCLSSSISNSSTMPILVCLSSIRHINLLCQQVHHLLRPSISINLNKLTIVLNKLILLLVKRVFRKHHSISNISRICISLCLNSRHHRSNIISLTTLQILRIRHLL